MADTTFTQTNAPIDLIELTEQQAEIMMIALDIGAYPDQEALLQAGFADAKAKVDIWKAEMQRRMREDKRVPAEQVFSELREMLDGMASELEQ